MTHQPKPAASPGTRRALVHNAITNALSDAGDWVPLSVRLTATRAALAEVDAWHAAEPDAACAHCGSSDHTWDDCEAYTRLVAEDGTAEPAAVSAAVAPPTQAAVSREAEAELYVLLRKAGEPRDEAQALIDRHRDEVLRRAELRRMADETATEHRPAVSRWRVETLDNLANEWAPGTGWAAGRLDARLRLSVHPDMDPLEREKLLADLREAIDIVAPVRPARQDGAES